MVPKAELVPAKFIEMLRILKLSDKEAGESQRSDGSNSSIGSKKEDRWALLLEAIKEKMGSYITQMVSDRTRSRYSLRVG